MDRAAWSDGGQNLAVGGENLSEDKVGFGRQVSGARQRNLKGTLKVELAEVGLCVRLGHPNDFLGCAHKRGWWAYPPVYGWRRAVNCNVIDMPYTHRPYAARGAFLTVFPSAADSQQMAYFRRLQPENASQALSEVP